VPAKREKFCCNMQELKERNVLAQVPLEQDSGAQMKKVCHD